jgi:hypothetical protein
MFKAKQLSFKIELLLDDITLKVHLEGGKLVFEPLNLGVAGGTVSSDERRIQPSIDSAVWSDQPALTRRGR